MRNAQRRRRLRSFIDATEPSPNIETGRSGVLAPILAALRVERADQSGYSDGGRPKTDHVPTLFDHAIWSLGWTDGRLSDQTRRENLDEFFANEAKLWVVQRKVEIDAEISSRLAACESLDADRTLKAEQLRNLREMQAEVARSSLRQNSMFSIFMACILFALGLLLLFADIPLTAQLATKSLGFPDAICLNPQDGTTSPYDPVQPCKPPMQIRRVEGGSLRAGGFTNFTDVFVLALALAACSFVVKLLMDAIHRGQFRKGSGDLFRAAMLAAVVVLFVGLLVVLGKVRYGGFEADTAVLVKQREGFQRNLDQLANGSDKSQRTTDEIERFRALTDQ